MPVGPPASELQMADAESLHKVGCGIFCSLPQQWGLIVWVPLGLFVGTGPPCAVQPRLDACRTFASELQMADAESLHKVGGGCFPLPVTCMVCCTACSVRGLLRSGRVLFNQGLMPAGLPASGSQEADAASLHKVGYGSFYLLVRCMVCCFLRGFSTRA
jgi:hypothetical protein